MLEMTGVEKWFGKHKALDGLELFIRKGELFGFVGPNGAGKTTTIKILAGLLKPDQGEWFLAGRDMKRYPKACKRLIGYMPDYFGVYDNLKVLEYMEFYASIYGLEGRKSRMRCKELLERMKLLTEQDAYVDDLSRGMKQRLCLARCMIHDPELLVLDEPASGMDQIGRAHV